MDEEEAEAVSPQLKAVNKNLADYNTEWDQFVDCWLVLRVSMPPGRALSTVCTRGQTVRLACMDSQSLLADTCAPFICNSSRAGAQALAHSL